MTIFINPHADKLQRLTKICALFSSDKVGERAAAAAKAHQLLKSLVDVIPLNVPTCRHGCISCVDVNSVV